MKKCYKCNTEKELTEFYKNKEMSDGHVNKCIICTREDNLRNYKKKAQDKEWFEKERKRNREKYHRLNYNIKRKERSPWEGTGEYKNLRNKLHPFLDNSVELHHWNYFEIEDVILLHTKDHKKIHRLIRLDTERRIFYIEETGEYLDTKAKHVKFIKDNI